MKLLYLANIRLPTEKAHGLQIMQMCEAFALAGAEVTLIAPRRVNTRDMNRITDPWAYYDVSHSFGVRRMFCIDWMWMGQQMERFAFPLQTATYTLSLVIWLLFQRADVYYSRDPLTLLILSLFKSRRTLCYEAHQLAASKVGMLVQSGCARRAGTVIAVTGRLADDLVQRGARRVVVAHDGFQQSRFEGAAATSLPDARASVGLPTDAFIVGYVGRLQTMNVSKGIDKLVEAIATIPQCDISLCLVGGPDTAADSLRVRWLELGLPAERFLFVGHVPPATVPAYLAAFDVCVMTLPDTDHFKYYASPLKLFEYMAAGKPIITSDHPAVAEVLRDGESVLLVPFGDLHALAAAITRLHDDPQLRARLGAAALRESAAYSWQARAARILQVIEEAA